MTVMNKVAQAAKNESKAGKRNNNAQIAVSRNNEARLY